MQSLSNYNYLIQLNEVFYESHSDLIQNICMELNCPDKIEELTEMFLNKQKFKVKKDPMCPKKAKTSYMFFCRDNRDKILKENPNILLGEQSKLLSKLWKEINPEDRLKYIEISNVDKQRYLDEKQEYSQTINN